jgi:hypothetical protein
VPGLCRALYKDSRLVKNPNLVLKTDEGADLHLLESSTAAAETVQVASVTTGREHDTLATDVMQPDCATANA